MIETLYTLEFDTAQASTTFSTLLSLLLRLLVSTQSKNTYTFLTQTSLRYCYISLSYLENYTSTCDCLNSTSNIYSRFDTHEQIETVPFATTLV